MSTRPLVRRLVVLAAIGVAVAAAVTGSALTTAPAGPSEPRSSDRPNLVAVGLGRAAPVRLVIPEIDVDAAIVPVRLTGGRLAAPLDGRRAGWYEHGTSPGERGSAVIVGRAEPERARGPAVFARLSKLTAGDRIDVIRDDGTTASFVVDRVERFNAERVHYDTGAAAQLRLVSSELVVWATFTR
ncbi:MAG TPA: sortase [Natronosporangium sp.]